MRRTDEMYLLPIKDMYSHATEHWLFARDADEIGRSIFHRHYSYRPYKDGRQPKHFVGPGQKMVLIGVDGNALFVWRKFISGDGQQGVNCSIFRNESDIKSSLLILEAMGAAWNRWPGERLFTYVNARKVRSANPGYCFKAAGWKPCGITKHNKLLIFETNPNP